MKRRNCFMALLAAVLLLGGCSKNDSEAVFKPDEIAMPIPIEEAAVSAPTLLPTPTPEPTPTPIAEGMAMNVLTGNYIEEEIARRRPIAVVINNYKPALPQSGISQADIYYEVLSEGDITRVVAIFQDFNSAKIGSIRSTRHYFIDLALNHDAIFVHHGGSTLGYSAIRDLKIDSMDGMKLDGTIFWRDKERMKKKNMYEHSSYTSTENIFKQIEKSKFRLTKAGNEAGMFAFYEEPAAPPLGVAAQKITVPFIGSNQSIFDYDAEKKLYFKTIYGSPQIDEENGEQLGVANVLIMNTTMSVIKNDEAGRRDVKLIGDGRGYIITNGAYAPVTWKKTGHESPVEWFDENGKKLTINKGKTWICILEKEPIFE